ncbi:expressed unknown protein [Seminavis robusta]|uniref:Uncharacterized protein n=1 Tax=Seminavis robusta TaxID=568900 RepID=A0A9N8HU51_9STRA|nr:expressed unknown protein [Seminavis robusta]|eukprot:Sro1604_g285380.1 n/a (382) ;mRNA; f:16212-17357
MIDIENPSTPPTKAKLSRDGPPLSPSHTATTFPSDGSPPTVTIDHKVSRSSRGVGGSLLLGMSKPVFALVAATVLATSGSAAWFFSEWLSIPGLKEQVSALEVEVTRLETQVVRLEHQVSRLSQEVDDLAFENDRYSMLNAQLNETAQEYQILNNQLNASTTRLESLNEQLGHSNGLFAELNAELSNQNQVYSSLNLELNQTQLELSALNDDLLSVVTFLNETSTNLQGNLESIVDFLAGQIDVNRFLVLETLENTYQQRTQSWDCGFRDFFLTEPFIQDPTVSIGSTELPSVLDFIESRLLTDLCLDLDDMQLYLQQTSGKTDLSDLTSNELIQGTSRYVTLVMEYYFGGNYGDDGGVSPEEWGEASYQCQNLQLPFLWS